MLKKFHFKKIFLFMCISQSIAVAHAEIPFNSAEVNTLQSYFFANITSTKNAVVKNDNGIIIYSIPGAVLASPADKDAKFTQDYQFHWMRDAAITMHQVAYLYEHAQGEDKNRLKTYLTNYIDFEFKAQNQTSRAGEQTLGQPKFNIDGNIWEGDWGRPQNDGPALRANTLSYIANIFISEGDEKFVEEKILNMIMTDLNYIAANWQASSFDLWEEINDVDHFFTKITQRKALLEGAQVVKHFGKAQQANTYLLAATDISKSLEKHWNANLGYFTETVHQQAYKGGGLDSSILLGVLYGNLHSPNDAFALNNDRVMSSIYFIRNAFKGLYRLNVNNRKGVLIGRYPNDIYDGDQFIYGNPWVLTTAALAQYYYQLASVFTTLAEIKITPQNIYFFQQINPDLVNREGIISARNNPAQFDKIINALIVEGDAILQNAKHYSTCYVDQSCLHFAEQIDRASGEPKSAKDLTWGYVALLDAMQARNAV